MRQWLADLIYPEYRAIAFIARKRLFEIEAQTKIIRTQRRRLRRAANAIRRLAPDRAEEIIARLQLE